MNKSFEIKWPVIIALAAILVRLVYLLEWSAHPGFKVPMVDERWHWEWAQTIFKESFWGEGAYFRAPLYPYFLAILGEVTGYSIFWSKFLQLLLCGGTAVFIYKLAGKLFGHTAAIISGFIYAFYGTLVFYEAMFLIPVLFLFLLVWGIYRLVAYRESSFWKTWVVTGVIFGLSAIARPNILLVVPFLALWLLWTRAKTKNFISRWKLPVVFIAGTILVVIPITVRNVIVTGQPILISSQGGVNLYLGNNPMANGLSMMMPEVVLDESIGWSHFIDATTAAAEKETGHSLNESEASSFWTGKAFDFILGNPPRFIGLLWEKSVYLVSGFENSDNIDIYFQRSHSYLHSLLVWHLNKILAFPFGLLLPLALLGIILNRERFTDLLPVYIFILAYIPTIILFLVTARHRLPLIPFLIILAAGGIYKVITDRRSWSTRFQAGIIILFVISLVVFNQTYYRERQGSDFQNYLNEGIQYLKLGDYNNAEKQFLLGDEQFPYSATLLTNLGYVQYMLGKYDLADRNLQRALENDPNSFKAYNNLGLLVEKKGLLDSAVVLYSRARDLFDSTVAKVDDLGQFYLNLAGVYEKQGKIDLTDSTFKEAISKAPLMYKAYSKAAAFFAQHGRYDMCDSLYSRADQLFKLSANDNFNWGLTYLERKEPGAGLALMQQALRLNPELFQAHYCAAAAHFELKSPDDSVMVHLDKCFEKNPYYEPAMRLKRSLESQR